MCSCNYNAAVAAEEAKALRDAELLDYESVITDLTTLSGNATKYIVYMYYLQSCMDELIVNGGPFDKGKVREARNEVITARNTLNDILAAVKSAKNDLEETIDSLENIIAKKWVDCYSCWYRKQRQMEAQMMVE